MHINEDVDDEGESKETKSHFDFGLYGNLNGNEYSGQEDTEHFAHAYFREELKEKGCNPDIILHNNLAKIATHIKQSTLICVIKHLAKNSSRYNNDAIGMTEKFDKQL